MVPVSTTICVVISLVISLVLPVLLLLLFARKYRKQGIVSAWLLGAAGFFVTQILIRMPILAVLQTQPGYQEFSQNHLFAYAFGLAFTAGLYELAGRLAVAKLMRKNLNYRRALAAGLGHGGIEAMSLVGITYVNNLAYIAMINGGTFEDVLAQAAAMGVDVSQLEMIREQLVTMSSGMFLLGGLERLLAMTAHVAMSVLVCYGVAHKKVLPCTLMCLGIHTFIDLTAGLSLVLPQSVAYPIIYAILIAVAVVSVLILRQIRRKWKEVSYDSEE